ncbi:hypothetical protein F383_21116 [Gossypium arboreum]|uniref:Uncharacterized protein n=3 Tax=Gossypium TaxID=3633 RepID=A0A0B0MPQ1_GOSAR|nr:uncharacterized protein LOC107897178 [Gossypium hirsutum]XP_017625147.1 uncharacterized protein LOC108468798 [Gossypium arboreum]TYI05540.1 hypothetical protein ES332_A10G095400v1 [Gossypium tomentosum]KAG4179064.1 hypothetical protein ERO13_A10G084600v2 [Gossypium hirsutum]KAG4179065.1 hypothetical protein ERO13_A10G084600v2 [Gossypium hirsutum]KHG01484.1 hypothetical protein F383_21116 [Gossypium arboreum]TYI05541.1 hypothetical protein ES332_A10G095400v1 [Gossypium tomentosum]
MSCFVLLSQCMFKASPSTSTTERPTDNPNSTAFIHSTALAAKEVVSYITINLCSLRIEAFHFVSSMELVPVSPNCAKCTSKNSAKLIGMVVKELGHPILDV